MKRILTISIALSVVLFALMSSDSTASAARPRIFVADTGLVTLGPNQLLRITVAPAAGGDSIPTESISFNFTKIRYSQRTCDGGVCKHFVTSQTSPDPITLAPGEAASMDVLGTTNSSGDGVVLLFSSLPGGAATPQVNALIIDTNTGAAWGNVDFEWKVEKGER